MSATYRVTLNAQGHLIGIAEYTLNKWGARQMSVYMHSLDTRFQWLADNPQFGKHRTELFDDIFSYQEGSHVVFYRKSDQGVEIIAVLHQSRDIERYFHGD